MNRLETAIHTMDQLQTQWDAITGKPQELNEAWDKRMTGLLALFTAVHLIENASNREEIYAGVVEQLKKGTE